MAIAVRSTSIGDTNAGAATSVTAVKPAGCVDTDILVAFAGTRNTAGGIAAPGGGGWSQVGTQTNQTGVGEAVFWKRALGEGANYIFTLSSTATHGGVIIVCLSGALATGNPIAAFNQQVANSPTVTCPALTMAAAVALLLAHAALARGSTTLVANNGYTARNTTDSGGTTGGLRQHVASLPSSGANPAAMTMTAGGTFNNVGRHIAVLEAVPLVGRSQGVVVA
jgi:hypothetical protein